MGLITVAGLSLLSAGAGAYGAFRQGEEASRAALHNRRMAMLAAMDARERGKERAGAHRRRGAQVAGAQRALAGAVGADTGAEAETVFLSELDATIAQNNAMREAWGLETQADHFLAQSQAARRQANVGIATSLLGGFAEVAAHGYGAYRDWRQVQIGSTYSSVPDPSKAAGVWRDIQERTRRVPELIGRR